VKTNILAKKSMPTDWIFNKSKEPGLHSNMNRVEGLVLSRPWNPLIQNLKHGKQKRLS
jgi:hypothetical protein